MRLLILVEPSANRVYAQQAPALAAAELTVLGGSAVGSATPVTVAGVDYLEVETGLDEPRAAELAARSSVCFAVYVREGDLLRPVERPVLDHFEDDLVTIPKYPGKTNEQFTRLLVGLAAASATRPLDDAVLLDPLCGRGTTLSTGLRQGYDVAGVETDGKAVEAYAAFLKTYLRRKRLKHRCELHPVRREGRSLGRRLEAEVTSPVDGRKLDLEVFTGDARDSAALFGRRRFDLVVTDAPYGVAHGSTSGSTTGKRRSRSAADLLTEALPVWAGQLKKGGALALSWNTYGMTREALSAVAVDAGLEPRDDDAYLQFAHRVDASIHRDVFVAVRPA
ncbi:hypothetical protein FHX74_000276 [Friedmanniella endophytica]|uniref:Methyltransferase domain-containing protein n=1 Tax=Microlunatus kandeliicorticis TaxID=1759536 RepID=A0A7W3IP75_9ACTN|nr:site-specific DNA-methyltransferase [Microlunatus kandeliicorticis]MBA8792682.1 hypothetical protein [Microlunatus kandeliicorticis]